MRGLQSREATPWEVEWNYLLPEELPIEPIRRAQLPICQPYLIYRPLWEANYRAVARSAPTIGK
jgi:hypothetical protein